MWNNTVKDWELIEDKTYDFIQSEADKKLKDSLEESEKITNRSYGLIAIMIVVFGALLGKVISYTGEDNNRYFIIVLIGSLILAYIFYNLYTLIKKRDAYSYGTDPSILFSPELLEYPNDNADDRHRRVALYNLEQTQYKITKTEIANEERINKFNNSLELFIYSLIGLAIVSLLAVIF